MNKSPHQSQHVVIPSHHIILYLLIEEKNAGNDMELHPYEENARGA
jgi:hypothetical protein